MIVGDVKTGLAPGEKGGNRFQRLCRFWNRVADPVQFARDWWCHIQMSKENGRRAFFDGTGSFFNETVFDDGVHSGAASDSLSGGVGGGACERRGDRRGILYHRYGS